MIETLRGREGNVYSIFPAPPVAIVGQWNLVCTCKIVGHGVEEAGTMYCCAHCARESGVEGVADRVDA
jgi:hypothetical protein